MKYIYCLVWLLTGPLAGQGQARYVTNGDCAFPAGKHFFNYVWDSNPLRNADLDLPAEKVGAVLVPAATHPTEVAASQQAYAAGHYTTAAQVVASLARLRPADPDVLDCYARALYRDEATREQSRPEYQKLIALLDRYGRESSSTASIYGLYQEAYFKLATLQLDSQEWAAATYNLSRAAGCLQALKELAADNQHLREQILQYQTECFAHLNQPTLCRYFGQRTLRFFPNNQYVRPYLAALPKAKPASRTRR